MPKIKYTLSKYSALRWDSVIHVAFSQATIYDKEIQCSVKRKPNFKSSKKQNLTEKDS